MSLAMKQIFYFIPVSSKLNTNKNPIMKAVSLEMDEMDFGSPQPSSYTLVFHIANDAHYRITDKIYAREERNNEGRQGQEE